MLLLWLCLGVSCLVMLLLRCNRTYRDTKRMFPSPTDWPLVGNAAWLLGKSAHGLYMSFVQLSKLYPGRCMLNFGPMRLMVVYDAEDVKAIVKCPDIQFKASTYQFLEPMIGCGLIVLNGDKYKVERKRLNPIFHISRIGSFLPIIVSEVRNACTKLDMVAGGDAFNVHPLFQLTSLITVLRTLNNDIATVTESKMKELLHLLDRGSEIVMSRFFQPWLYADWLFYKTQRGKQMIQINNDAKSLVRTEIEFMFQIYENRQLDDAEEKEEISFSNMMYKCWKQGEKTMEEIVEGFNTMFGAASDTTATALSIILQLLGKHQDVQEKVLEEITEVFGNSDRTPTLDDLRKLRYTEQVINETMRLYPTIPIMGRRPTKNVQLSGDRYIPSNCDVFVFLRGLHTNPKYWDNPETFNPDNFSPEAVAQRHPNAFLPFSGGLRNCIGSKYAMVTMKATLSILVPRYRVLSNPATEDIMKNAVGIVLLSDNGIRIRIEKRKRSTEAE